MKYLDENTFLNYAMNCYDNPACNDIEEFEEDLKRFQYLRKLFNRYKQTGELKERLVLNHLIILYNVFGDSATDMLYMRLEGFHSFLKPFTDYLNYTKPTVVYNNKLLRIDLICSDQSIASLLKRI